VRDRFEDEFPEYVSAEERRRRAARRLAELRAQGHEPRPIRVDGRDIASTFWGKAWCEHLENHADFASRLPRGRSYLRNGSVLDLHVAKGEVRALVSGTDVYEVRVRLRPLAAARWEAVRRACAGRIGTVVELLAGKLSSAVMKVLCDPAEGIFPATRELELSCSCPDGARLCKHLAAVLYGVGARLDEAPELLFLLRGVDGAELVAAAGDAGSLAGAAPAESTLDVASLGEIFGIELATGTALPETPRGRTKRIAAPRNPTRRRAGRRRARS
jgi:uncharacterized Zn finger protein